MHEHWIAAALFSLWMVLILRLHRRALELHRKAAAKRNRRQQAQDGEPMAVRVKMLHL